MSLEALAKTRALAPHPALIKPGERTPQQLRTSHRDEQLGLTRGQRLQSARHLGGLLHIMT